MHIKTQRIQNPSGWIIWKSEMSLQMCINSSRRCHMISLNTWKFWPADGARQKVCDLLESAGFEVYWRIKIKSCFKVVFEKHIRKNNRTVEIITKMTEVTGRYKYTWTNTPHLYRNTHTHTHTFITPSPPAPCKPFIRVGTVTLEM